MFNKKFLTVMAALLGVSLFFIGCSSDSDDPAAAVPDKADSFDLTVLIVRPVTDAPSVAAVTATAQYTGSVVWKHGAEFAETLAGGANFAGGTVYRADVTLEAESGYTFDGVGEDVFRYTGVTEIKNPAGTGTTLTVTIVFPQTVPTIGINTTGFNALTTVVLPTGLAGIKTVAGHTQITDTPASTTYFVADSGGTTSGLLAAFRTAGGKPVIWDNSGTSAAAFWKDTAANTNVRADITVTSGDEASAYLLVNDGENTYEVVKGGFFARYVGNSIGGTNGLNSVSSLTFGATVAGTYTVKIAINKVNGTTGDFVETLAEQTLNFTVALPSIGISTTGFNALSVVTLPSGLTNIKSVTGHTQVEGTQASTTYSVADSGGTGDGGLLKGFRDTAGSKPVTWDNSGDNAAAFWKDNALTNVRADITVTSGNADTAYLLVNDGISTYEVVKGGFFALYIGNSMTNSSNGLNKVSSLTFGATAAGTYTVKIAINKVNGETGALEQTLAEQTLDFTVSSPAGS
jgi:hypothetical protein